MAKSRKTATGGEVNPPSQNIPKDKSSGKKAKTKVSRPGKPYDVFVVMMFVSTAALLMGCAFLVLALDRFNWQLAP